MNPLHLLALILPISVFAQNWEPLPSPRAESPSKVVSCGTRLIAFTFGGPKVSDDSGKTWQRKATGLPEQASILVGESNNGTLIGNFAGKVWRSTNCGDSWHDWSEGLAPSREEPYNYLALGDTVTLLQVGIDTSARIWRRTTSTQWMQQPNGESLENEIYWTGKGFLSSIYNERIGKHSLRFSRDGSQFKEVLGQSNWRITYSARNDTAWALKNRSFFRSADGGETWDSIPWSETKFQNIEASPFGFFVDRNDSTLHVDPIRKTKYLVSDDPNAYYINSWVNGTKLTIVGSRGLNFVSNDSGKTWKSVAQTESGFLSGAILKQDRTMFSALRSGVWSDTGNGIWNLDPNSRNIGTLFQDGNVLYSAGWSVYRRSKSGWLLESIEKVSKRYSQSSYQITREDGIRWLSNGDDLFYAITGSTSWRTADTIPEFGSTMSDFLAFGGKLWQTRYLWRDTVSVSLIAKDPNDLEPWAAYQLPHSTGGTRLAASQNTLWVGTDSGLFRSDDTGKTFSLANLPKYAQGLTPNALEAQGNNVAVTVSDYSFLIWNAPRTYTLVSTDNGATWQAGRADLIANALYVDSLQIYAAMFGNGLYRWNSSTTPSSMEQRKPKLERLLTAFKNGILLAESLQTESVMVELYAMDGSLVLSKAAPSGTPKLAISLHPGVYSARVIGSSVLWQGSLLIP